MNNVVVHNTTIVNVTNITYSNFRVNNAVIATTHEHFGNGHVQDVPVHVTQTRGLEHVHGTLPVKPKPASLIAGAHSGTRPPDSMLSRPVVAIRPPHEPKLPWSTKASKSEAAAQERRYVLVPSKHTSTNLPRPEFGARTGAERSRDPLPPRFAERRLESSPGSVAGERAATGRIETPVEPRIVQQTERVAPRTVPHEPATPPRAMREVAPPRAVQEPAMPTSRRSSAPPVVPRNAAVETRQQERADLPGQPANRVFSGKDNEMDSERIERRSMRQKPDGQ